MATYHAQTEPLILLVPGHPDGGGSAWMRSWERQRGDCEQLDLGMWDKPHRNTWVNKLNLAIHRADRPVILVAHDIACLAVAWWAEYEQAGRNEAGSGPVIGALLVSPPDVDRPGSDARLASFGACPRGALPFPSFVVADRAASQPKLVTTTQLAGDWKSLFTLDEIDGDGDGWEAGRYLLRRLLREHRPAVRVSAVGRVELGPVREVFHA
jgi:predicted alpha/beta hydrolase family esterase